MMIHCHQWSPTILSTVLGRRIQLMTMVLPFQHLTAYSLPLIAISLTPSLLVLILETFLHYWVPPTVRSTTTTAVLSDSFITLGHTYRIDVVIDHRYHPQVTGYLDLLHSQHEDEEQLLCILGMEEFQVSTLGSYTNTLFVLYPFPSLSPTTYTLSLATPLWKNGKKN